MSANWPIRVGGEYPMKDAEHIRRVITAIDGEDVYYTLRSRYSENEWSELHHGSHKIASCLFRMVCLPEDASSIPDLIAALKACLTRMKDDGYHSDEVEQAEEALAKAGAL